MNKLDQLYAEFGSNICLFPFLSGFYSKAAGTSLVMPCSMTKPIDWRIRNNSIISTVNNDTWIELRKNFIHGSCHTTEYCGTCSYAEKNGGTSARKLANQFLLDKISIDPVEEVRRIIDNDYIVDRLYTLDYCPSNYCNYECIMCFGPASSTRNTFEIKMLGQGMAEKYDHTTVTSDFYSMLDTIEVLNFTGGETLLQTQVHDLIDYLIDRDLAKNITISLLTNASKYPEKLVEKFKKFKDVLYTISIDGVGTVIEYQRRRAVWSEVEQNAIKLWNNMSGVVNYVLTAVNVFSFLDFVDWASKHNINRVYISIVFDRTKHLSVSVIPPELKDPLLSKLRTAVYTNEYYNGLVEQVIKIIESTPYEPQLLDKFVQSIIIEDKVSKRSLTEVVPEWGPYFVQT
jgi:sulfatase maturation enzyme AslB (radical SAM superfamily)